MANSNELAQIKAINKGLTTLNSTLNATTANYLTLVKTIENGSKTIKDNTVSYDNLGKAQKATTDAGNQLDQIGKQLAASEQKLKEVEDSRMKTIIENRVATQQSTQAIKDKIKAEQGAEGSLVRMRARLKELTQEYDKAGTRTKAATAEINNLSREIGKAEAATNRHGRGVGGYAEQLGKLPGPIGGVISGLTSVGKTMWLLVANPIGAVIAGIVAAFAALSAVFTSTAGGAKLIKEIMASISAVFDVVKQSTVLVIDAFKALFSGEFSKAADLFGDSMDNLTENTGAAAKAAWDLVDAQSALNKELTFHVSEQAQENNLIQKNLFLAKDKTKSDAERLGFIKEAMAVSEENSKKEIDYAKRQFVIDTDKAALKAKVSGVTADQLRAFIALGAEEQKITLESSASLKKMWDLIGGSDKFKPLEESYAKVIEADTEFFSKNKRTMSQMSSLQNELAQEKVDREKKAAEDAKKAADQKIYEDSRAAYSQLGNSKMVLKETKVIKEDGLKSNQEYLDKQLKQAEEAAEKEKQLAADLKQAKIDLAIEAGNAIFEFRNMAIQKEINALQVEKDAKLANSKLTTEQRAAIEADYEKKSNALKAKQAKNDKLQALFNIAIQTAVGATKAVAASPLTGGMPFLAFVLAMGVIQAALVAAQPIPKYAKGTMSAADRFIAGEAGRELMMLRSGEVGIADKATYFEGSKFKGAKIFSNPETERIIGATDRGIGGQSVNNGMISELRDIKKAILNKPVAIYDKDHRQIGLGDSKHQTIYLNRLTR